MSYKLHVSRCPEQDSNNKPLVETRITFNGGGKWQRIKAPGSFIHPKCNRCDALMRNMSLQPSLALRFRLLSAAPRCSGGGEGDCYLHLRGMSSWDSMATSYPAVYSNPSAPGFIMATGVSASKGMGLEDDPDG